VADFSAPEAGRERTVLLSCFDLMILVKIFELLLYFLALWRFHATIALLILYLRTLPGDRFKGYVP